ncbi:MAG TPA: DNA polymerase III subunit [Pyrinomonadaceae bacterium]|nr:DNA polymerase III subunit [Pyrinomonadaceae bacterium]
MIGNQHVKDILRRMLAKGRVPGALLFAGADGIGKKLFAIELAKALNCRASVRFEACDACPSCLRTARFTYPAADDTEANKRIIWSEHSDVGVVRPAGRFINVQQLRELEREANFRPYEGAARLFIIDDANKLNEASSNALLKTLEEPPRTTHLVLITARPAALLPTIRSRCQALRFAPLAADEIETHLVNRRKISGGDAALRARAAQGSIGRALSIDLESYRSQREAMMDILDALVLKPDRARLLRASEELADAKRKDEYEPRLDVLVTLIHDSWALSLGAPHAQVINSDILEQLVRLGARMKSRVAADWLARIEQHRRGLDVNINRKVATDALLLGMAGGA